ncbi:MAG: UvrB/UvrC motif-containing protein, partial [Candidatus Aenigmatarchaeota archaeon]
IEVYLVEEERINKFLEFDKEEFEMKDIIAQLEKEMYLAAKNLQFEKAAQLRDKIKELKEVIKSE